MKLGKLTIIAGLLLGASVSLHAQLKVLFLGFDFSVSAVQSDILGADSRFDHINSSASADSSLTLATLGQYDAVLAWANISPPTAVSDLLADYVDMGGGVVLGTFWGQVLGSGGRLGTTGYNPLVNPHGNGYDAASLGTYDSASPFFEGVSSLSASTYRGDYYSGLDSGATLVASWDDGSPLLAYNSGRNVVNLTLFPNVAEYDHATGDYQQLFRNSLAFVAGAPSAPMVPVPEPSTYGLIGAGVLLGLAFWRRRATRR